MSTPPAFVSISEARERPGLRLVVLRGLPSPWSQAARAILRVKRIDHVLVQRAPDDPPGALEAWTGQASFPALMFEHERPRSGWAEILLLAERLAPEPALLPADPGRRALCLGVCHEVCGEMGLGWARRLEMVAAGLARTPPDPLAKWLGDKYGYSAETGAQAPARVHEVLGLLASLLAEARARGERFFFGPGLGALDLYWATFANLVAPLPPELLPMPEPFRAMFTSADPEVHALLAKSGLLEHRERVYREHLELPVAL